MSTKFIKGNVYTNKEISEGFKVGNMGGMRRSLANNVLVLISDHTKSLYEDKWYDDIFHYTGMGKIGDQDINLGQNKTLAQSVVNGIELHLFEVYNKKEYIYQGISRLVEPPYQEKQLDDNSELRNVWVFPLKIINGVTPLDDEIVKTRNQKVEKEARELTNEELMQRAKRDSTNKVATRLTKQKTYNRSPYIAEYAKRRANGICQLCGKEAPFIDKDGKPYLESHHIVWMSEGGEDSIDNTVALCPNCHRRMHILNAEEDIMKLENLTYSHE